MSTGAEHNISCWLFWMHMQATAGDRLEGDPLPTSVVYVYCVYACDADSPSSTHRQFTGGREFFFFADL
jgi:hypothetical protein